LESITVNVTKWLIGCCAVLALWQASSYSRAAGAYQDTKSEGFQFPLQDRLPTWALPAFESREFQSAYVLSDWLNPFYVCGDFDGDHLQDIAVLVRQRSSGKAGIGLMLQAAGTVTVFGAGKAFANSNDDWNWIRLWRAENQRSATLYVSHRGDMLFLTSAEFKGGIISWDSSAWRWTPLP
jgi:hypothetical protein